MLNFNFNQERGKEKEIAYHACSAAINTDMSECVKAPSILCTCQSIPHCPPPGPTRALDKGIDERSFPPGWGI